MENNKLQIFIHKKADDINTIGITDSIGEEYLEKICEEYFLLKTELNIDPNKEKPFIVATLRELEKQVSLGEISYSFMVEELNRIAKEFYSKENNLASIENQLDEWIESCRLQAEIFSEKCMVVSENSSLSMLQAYKNVKKLIIANTSLNYTTQDILDAVQYGFDYRSEAQNDNVKVPIGNVLQWIMYKKDLLDIPEEFNQIKKSNL